LSDYNPPPLAPPARGGDLYRYSLPSREGGLEGISTGKSEEPNISSFYSLLFQGNRHEP